MGELVTFAVKVLSFAVLVTSFFATGVAMIWYWRRPNISFHKVALISASILPILVASLSIVLFVIDSFNSEPITGPQAQGFLVIVIVAVGGVLVGMPMGYAVVRGLLAMLNRR